MNEQNWFRRFRQYGYDTDVFDKYRDAVSRYNRSALRVLGLTGCLAGLITLVVLLIDGKTGGLFFAVLMLIAGIAGSVVARMKDVDRRIVQAAVAAAAVGFIAAGILNGSALDVLIKAITVCSECIGLG